MASECHLCVCLTIKSLKYVLAICTFDVSNFLRKFPDFFKMAQFALKTPIFQIFGAFGAENLYF